jgi:hypothetical protein
MVDQVELIDQYRATLQVMKDKQFALKEEKQRKMQEILEKQKTSQDFQKLEQSLEILQEGIQSLNLEIFKEKGRIRKLRSETDWVEDKQKSSEEFKSLAQELESLQSKNNDLKSLRNDSNGDSKLAQLEHNNPKLFILVKRMIAAEESSFLLKEEMNYLEQERNKVRAEYHKYTHCLGQEEKVKLKLRENEKEYERYQASCKYFKLKSKDLEELIEMEKEKVARSGTKDLMERLEILNKQKSESGQLVDKLSMILQNLEKEIVSEKTKENKEIPPNLKQEIRALEQDITQHNKDLKLKLLEKKKLQSEYESKMKTVINTRRSSTKNTREGFYKSKHVISKSSTCLNSAGLSKREALVGILAKNLAEVKHNEIGHYLRNFGSQDQGIASKLVCLNRDEFLKRLKLK